MCTTRVLAWRSRRPIGGQHVGDLFAQGVDVGVGCRARARRNRPRSGRSASSAGPWPGAARGAGSRWTSPRPAATARAGAHRAPTGRCWPAAGTGCRPAGCRCGCPRCSPSSVRIPALRNAFTSASTRLSLTLARTRSIRAGVRDPVEARLDVSVQHPPVTLGAEPVDLGDRVVRPPLRPEPVGDRQEVGLEDRFQHQLQRRLDHPVGDGRDPQTAELPRPAWLSGSSVPAPATDGTSRPSTDARRSSRNPGHHRASPRRRRPSGRRRRRVLAPVLPATRSNATISVAGSCTKLNRSSNRRPGSAAAQR